VTGAAWWWIDVALANVYQQPETGRWFVGLRLWTPLQSSDPGPLDAEEP
jgi:hypothetical protein